MQKMEAARPTTLRREWLVAAGLVALTIVVFLPSLDCQFVNLDDTEYATNNHNIKAGLTRDGIRWAAKAFVLGNWHPLTILSLQFDATFWKAADGKSLDPRGFHLTNVLFHAGSAALLFWALRLFTGSVWRSAAAAALFAVHPLRVESVAWVAERKDVLSTFFGMAALLAYALYARRPTAARYLAVVGAMVLSLLCKQMLVTLPCLFLVLDWWPLGRAKRLADWRWLAIEKVPLFVVAAAFSAIVYYVQAISGAVMPIDTFSPFARVGNAIVSYVSYLAKTVWPANLAVFYPHRAYPWGSGLGMPKVAGAWLLLTAVTTAAVLYRRRAPYLLTGWLWYLGTLVPVIGFLQIGDQAYADRYSYFPQVGLLIAACWGVAELLQSRPRLAAAVATVAVVLFAFVSRQQIGVWQDSVTLWEHDLHAVGESPLCLTDLGIALEAAGRRPEAEQSLRRSLELSPKAVLTHINLGNFLYRDGRLDEAAEQFQIACDWSPLFAHPKVQLAEVRLRQNRLDEATALNEAAKQVQPDFSGAYCSQGLVEIARGNLDAAAESFEHALRLDPDMAAAHSGLGLVLVQRKKKDEGLSELREAIRCDPHFGDGHLYLAVVLRKLKGLEAAAPYYEAARYWSPGLAQAWFGCGEVLWSRGLLREAEENVRRARELDPNSAAYKDALDKIRKHLGEPVSSR
jgi:tetratricopeptide (TPR) repeat protein